MRWLVCLFAAAGMTVAAAPARKGAPVRDANLWAGLGVTRPAIRAEDVTDRAFFMVSFTLVNDGAKTIDPEVDSSQLLVNGKELKDWAFIVGNGPKGTNYNALPPGGCLEFGYAMGEHFKQPGVYRVKWKGKAFESAEVVFRVLPKKAG